MYVLPFAEVSEFWWKFWKRKTGPKIHLLFRKQIWETKPIISKVYIQKFLWHDKKKMYLLVSYINVAY